MDIQDHVEKPVMVFLPGKLCDQRVWQQQMTQLSDIIQPICVDLRYCETLDDMLSAVGHSCKVPFLLAGFSLGGYVAQEFILKYPERVRGLVLAGFSAKGFTEEEKQTYIKLMKAVREGKATVMTGNALRQYISPKHYGDIDLVNLIEDMANTAGDAVFLRQQQATLNRVKRFEDIAKISCPVLIIAGSDDKLVTLADSKSTASAIPNAEFQVIQESGHMTPLEQPDKLTKILREWIVRVINMP
ncbi:MAG: alpha/beta hydrolase [Legionellales bacterium]|nr:alpha/beta hydrolase [Legionellales bacterium]